MKNKALWVPIAGVVAVIVLVVTIVIVAVRGGDSSAEADTRPSPTASSTPSKSSPKATPTRTAKPTPTPSPTPEYVQVVLGCTDAKGQLEEYATMQEVWALPVAPACNYNKQYPGTLSEQQTNALQTAYGPEYKAESLKYLYGVCARTSGIPIEEVRSGAQATELAGAYILCPDHPKAAAIEATITSGQTLVVEEEANKTAIAEGRQFGSGKYLIGVDLQPGQWQTVGEKVSDCYWEISDAQGNIIENNFISVAPQFTITVPEWAAGFTIQGCAFRQIG